jgi:hypothetical protein
MFGAAPPRKADCDGPLPPLATVNLTVVEPPAGTTIGEKAGWATMRGAKFAVTVVGEFMTTSCWRYWLLRSMNPHPAIVGKPVSHIDVPALYHPSGADVPDGDTTP